MTKIEFLNKLNSKLSNFPETEVNDRLSFYIEMIDDYMDEGLTESEAVEKLGSIDEIAESIAGDIPLVKIAKKNLKTKRKLSGLEITLLIVGFPIWFSLLVALFAVVISLYVSIWSVLISIWACGISFSICSLGTILLFIVYLCVGNVPLAFMLLSCSLVLFGLSILFFLLCKYLTIWVIKLTNKMLKSFKNLFIKKEE
ncbi:MAG: DUF1700 domain-containing protein [Erysipelotrichaceae bacterium]|nr:DUF1700 domain-containing protein [Erysipelotrichaceae bacterium]